MGPGRTPGRVAVLPTVPGARHGRLAPPALRWRSRRAFWFGTQRRLPARGQGPGWRLRQRHRPPHRHQKAAPRTPPGLAARPAHSTRGAVFTGRSGAMNFTIAGERSERGGGGVAAAFGGSVTVAGHRAWGQAGRGPRVLHRADPAPCAAASRALRRRAPGAGEAGAVLGSVAGARSPARGLSRRVRVRVDAASGVGGINHTSGVSGMERRESPPAAARPILPRPPA